SDEKQEKAPEAGHNLPTGSITDAASLLGKIARNAETLDGSAKEDAARLYFERHARLLGILVKAIGDAKPALFEDFSKRSKPLDPETIDKIVALIQTLMPVAWPQNMYREIGSKNFVATIERVATAPNCPDEIRVICAMTVFYMEPSAGLRLIRFI